MDPTSYLLIISCVLSICGNCLMIYMYKRIAYQNNLALTLICYMSISDLVFSIANLLYFIQEENTSNTLCTIQGVLLQFSELSCFIFCFELMVCIYLSVVSNYQNMHLQKNKFILVGFLVPAITSLIPIWGHAYGGIDYSCGFDSPDAQNRTLVNVEALLFFYIPLWAFNIANLYLIICVVKFIKGFRSSREVNLKEFQQDQEIRLSQRILMNMVSYPVIMILCWSGFTVYKIAQLCGTELEWLKGPRFILPDLIGFFNSIAYIINHFLFKKLQNIISNEHQMMHLMNDKNNRGDRKYNESFRSFMSTTSSTDYDITVLETIDI